MKRMLLELQDIDGNVNEKKIINVNEKDKVIVRFDETVSQQQAGMIFNSLGTALQDEHNNVIGIPKGITLEVLKIN
ncbi:MULTISPECIES: hypothetical protein [Bacillus]|uniref:Uncharacterized protein n=1 Tax=Bacillus stercoris TaxID=2054641 RepID=A0ABU0V254_9BACI|nr:MULTISPECIES: hypothetical protein [Bacillus subtilis group]UAW07923.1 hypothetical protein [Bacillus phage BUCT082]MDQ1851005.1 hypothetical protein [Bacillus stercoris]MDR4182311.1 hypothetical protein [Bacillus subtilis]PRS01401.1 hypothetical protein C6W26_17840 [Bacillus halotolerans]QHJ97830.1 hypothetical protein C7M17_00911 [Bacillus subtilis]